MTMSLITLVIRWGCCMDFSGRDVLGGFVSKGRRGLPD